MIDGETPHGELLVKLLDERDKHISRMLLLCVIPFHNQPFDPRVFTGLSYSYYGCVEIPAALLDANK